MKLFKITLKMAALMLLFSLSFFCAADDGTGAGTGLENLVNRGDADNSTEPIVEITEEEAMAIAPALNGNEALYKVMKKVTEQASMPQIMKLSSDSSLNQKITAKESANEVTFEGSETVTGTISGTASVEMSGYINKNGTIDIMMVVNFVDYSDEEGYILNCESLTFSIIGSLNIETEEVEMSMSLDGEINFISPYSEDNIIYEEFTMTMRLLKNKQEIIISGTVIVNGESYTFENATIDLTAEMSEASATAEVPANISSYKISPSISKFLSKN